MSTNEESAAVWMSPNALKAWGRNPRLNDSVVAQVASSIQRFGFGAPIVARAEDQRIIAGHARWKAAKQLGLERVPVRLLELTEREADLLALADNRLNELAPWDVPELQRLLGDFDLADVELAGWSSKDIQKMAADFLPGTEESQGALDEIQQPTITCPNCGHEFAKN
jgi:ParB-like chromosome segregation protein Spo0J